MEYYISNIKMYFVGSYHDCAGAAGAVLSGHTSED